MNRKSMLACCITIVIGLTMVTSCDNDIGEIENQNYGTAIGVDFRDGKYFIYIQLIGLGAVAKSETGQKSPPEVYVSKTSGKTFIDAFFKAYQSAQERILWAHVTAIVFSKSALEKGLDNIFDGLTRYYEFRPTPWVFGTNESIEGILSAAGFFKQSSLNTILHNPKGSYEQSSMILPVKLNKFGRELFEPARTTYIPSLTLNKKQWKKNNKSEPKLAIDGAFFLKNQKFKEYFTLEELKGLRWLTSETERSSLLVPNRDKPEFLAVIEDQKVKLNPIKSGENFQFAFTFLANGMVSNRIKNDTLNIEAMEDLVKNSIFHEVKELFQLGVEKNVDFLNLEHQLYREHSSAWKQLKDPKSLLREDAIKTFHAEITIKHAGSFKNKRLKIKE